MRIRDLLAIPHLRLRLLWGEEHLDRVIGGAQVTDLPDPGRYVAGGELVLTGLMWLREPADCDRFVDVLATAGVAALGAGDAWLGHVPEALVRACRERDLPLVEVPVEVSFGAVVYEVNRRRAEVRAGELSSALGRHRRVVAAVAEGAGLAELLTLTASELGVTCAVISAAGTLIAGRLEAPPDAAEAARQEPLAGRLAREFLEAERLPHVARVDGGTYTLFAVDRSHRAAGWALVCAGEPGADVGLELAALVALERNRQEEGRRVERRLAAQLIALAAAANPDSAELAARLRTCGIEAGEPYAVVAATVRRPGTARGPDPATLGGQVLEELLDRRAVAVTVAETAPGTSPGTSPGTGTMAGAGTGAGPDAGPGGAVAIVPLASGGLPATAGALAERLRAGMAALAPALIGANAAVGVSAAAEGPGGVRGAVEEARHAWRAAESRGGGVVTSDEIYTHDLLLATVPDDVRRSFAARLLDPLFDYDRRHRSELVRTLATFLECTGSWHTCAARLHVHVNTVRYRIRRVEELTGRDLSSMTDRVDLFLALRAS